MQESLRRSSVTRRRHTKWGLSAKRILGNATSTVHIIQAMIWCKRAWAAIEQIKIMDCFHIKTFGARVENPLANEQLQDASNENRPQYECFPTLPASRCGWIYCTGGGE